MSEQQPERGHRIERGQEYLHHGRLRTIRVRVVADEHANRVDVVDAYTGKRPRSILACAFHNNPRRVTGYRLVRHADGRDA